MFTEIYSKDLFTVASTTFNDFGYQAITHLTRLYLPAKSQAVMCQPVILETLFQALNNFFELILFPSSNYAIGDRIDLLGTCLYTIIALDVRRLVQYQFFPNFVYCQLLMRFDVFRYLDIVGVLVKRLPQHFHEPIASSFMKLHHSNNLELGNVDRSNRLKFNQNFNLFFFEIQALVR
jgi:hypothetical protein